MESQSANLIKKRLWYSCFPVIFVLKKVFKNTLLYRQPPVVASVIYCSFEIFRHFGGNYTLALFDVKTPPNVASVIYCSFEIFTRFGGNYTFSLFDVKSVQIFSMSWFLICSKNSKFVFSFFKITWNFYKWYCFDK